METSLNELVKNFFTGMAEGRMSQVMPKGNGLGQILIEPEGFGDRPGNLRDFEGMG
jgi:hypothetical protein